MSSIIVLQEKNKTVFNTIFSLFLQEPVRDGKSLQNRTDKTLSLKKLAHKICAEKAQNCAKKSKKRPTIAHKKCKNLK